MYCDNSKEELKETDEVNFAQKASPKNRKIKSVINVICKSVVFKWIITSVICVAIIIVGVVIADYYGSDGSFYRQVMSVLSFDEKVILGSWEMTDETRYDIGDVNGYITEITFYSDGTCTVGGTSSPETGYWSIVDNQLKVEGEMGGMFWNYNGFIMPYDLDAYKLEIYDDYGNSFTYLRKWLVSMLFYNIFVVVKNCNGGLFALHYF